MTALLDPIKYAEHEWNTCGDLELNGRVFRMKLRYSKFCTPFYAHYTYLCGIVGTEIHVTQA